jgi:hypothetical protein
VSLRFTVGDPKAAQAEARRLAIEDAKSKAAAMAKAAGVNLGRAISISDLSSSSGPIGPQGFSGVAGAPAPVAQVPVSDLDVVVRVQVQFELQ